MKTKTYLAFTLASAVLFLAVIYAFPSDLVYTISIGVLLSVHLGLQTYFLRTSKRNSCLIKKIPRNI